MLAASIPSLNVAVTVASSATSVASGSGCEEATVGAVVSAGSERPSPPHAVKATAATARAMVATVFVLIAFPLQESAPTPARPPRAGTSLHEPCHAGARGSLRHLNGLPPIAAEENVRIRHTGVRPGAEPGPPYGHRLLRPRVGIDPAHHEAGREPGVEERALLRHRLARVRHRLELPHRRGVEQEAELVLTGEDAAQRLPRVADVGDLLLLLLR